MYFANAMRQGSTGNSPTIVMAGIVVNDQRLTRTQVEFAAIFKNLGDVASGTLRELKSADLLAGTGAGFTGGAALTRWSGRAARSPCG